MEAVEYLRARTRMCRSVKRCDKECGSYDEADGCTISAIERGENPEDAVEIVQRWAEAHPVEGGVRLTAMERRFAHIYIEKGYLWAARDKDGELNLYKREPKRGGDVFINTSPAVNGSRTVIGLTFSRIDWENSPVCLPKLLEREE